VVIQVRFGGLDDWPAGADLQDFCRMPRLRRPVLMPTLSGSRLSARSEVRRAGRTNRFVARLRLVLLTGAVQAIEGIRQSAPRLTVGRAARDSGQSPPPSASRSSGGEGHVGGPCPGRPSSSGREATL
jgi:hypothetical protein